MTIPWRGWGGKVQLSCRHWPLSYCRGTGFGQGGEGPWVPMPLSLPSQVPIQ